MQSVINDMAQGRQPLTLCTQRSPASHLYVWTQAPLTGSHSLMVSSLMVSSRESLGAHPTYATGPLCPAGQDVMKRTEQEPCVSCCCIAVVLVV
jgi:hypothetical protein